MVKNWCNVLSMEGVTVCGHLMEDLKRCEESSFVYFWVLIIMWILYSCHQKLLQIGNIDQE